MVSLIPHHTTVDAEIPTLVYNNTQIPKVKGT